MEDGREFTRHPLIYILGAVNAAFEAPSPDIEVALLTSYPAKRERAFVAFDCIFTDLIVIHKF